MGFTGTVSDFDRIKGFGFVPNPNDAYSDDDVFVHVNSLVDPADKQAFGNGTVIEYQLEDSDRGLRAENVKVIDSANRRETSHTYRQQVTEALLYAEPALTGDQILNIRSKLVSLAEQNGWVDT